MVLFVIVHVMNNKSIVLYMLGKIHQGEKGSCMTLRIHMSQDKRFPTMWYVRPAKAQTSLRIRAD